MNVMEARRRTLGGGVYEKTVSGETVLANGSLARRYPGLHLYGQSTQESTTGTQLFDISKVISRPGRLENNGDILHVTTIPGDAAAYGLPPNTLHDYAPTLKAGQTYYLTANSTGETKSIYLGETVWNFNSSRVVTENMLQSAVYFYASGEETEADISDIMLNAGSTALPYEPYTGGAPSPSPDYPQEIVSAGNWNKENQKWEYEIEVAGGNCFNDVVQTSTTPYVSDGKGGIIVTDSDGKPNNMAPTSIYVIKGLTYYVTADSDSPIAIYNTDATYRIATVNGNGQFVAPETGYLHVKIAATEESYPINFGKIMVNIGTEALPWEPYRTPQTVTLTSDRPLTKWDRLEKRCGQWGWVYKSAEIVLDGSEDENWTAYSGYSGFQSVGVLPFIDVRREGFSEDIIVKTGTSDLGLEFEIWLGVDNSNIYVVRVPQHDLELPDKGLQNWVDWLSENPITILTYLDEETFVPLSASEQEQMNALYTFRPTTVLSNDADCEMELTYKTRKGLEVTT